MNFYKKIIKSKKMRFHILALLKAVPDKTMLKIQYYIKHGRKLNLENPVRYTEKLQWYKLYYHDKVMARCADKYMVREYIKEKGLENILNQLYGVYNDIDEVNWEELPDKFAIKTTNGSGTNFFCKDKSQLNIEKLKDDFRDYFKQSSVSAGREWVYSDQNRKIIIEELLEDKVQADGAINDYKFLCFNGQPEFIVYDTDRFTNHKRNIYDLEWNDLHIESDCKCCDKKIAAPEHLSEMISIAKTLSEDFPAVRVDLYSIEGKIYFGELTFFPWSGYVQFNPDEFDFELGKKFMLPEKR